MACITVHPNRFTTPIVMRLCVYIHMHTLALITDLELFGEPPSLVPALTVATEPACVGARYSEFEPQTFYTLNLDRK